MEFFPVQAVYPSNPGHGPDILSPLVTNRLVIPENMVGPNISGHGKHEGVFGTL